MIVVAGCVAQAEGEEIVRRAAGRRYGRRAAKLSPAAGADRRAHARAARGRRHRVSGRGQVRCTCRRPHRRDPQPRRHRFPDRAGRLRQILHVLRRALHARRREVAPGREASSPRPRGWRRRACARSRCSARTSTPITGEGRTAPASPRRPAARGGRGARPRRLRYTTSHPRDMDDALIAAHRDSRADAAICICRCSRAPTESSRR